jgi:hypothetical protein
MQRGQATANALSDDALRAAEVSGDLGIAAPVQVAGLDRLALLEREIFEQLDRRSAGGRFEDLDRFLIELDQLRSASLSLWRAIANNHACGGSGPS